MITRRTLLGATAVTGAWLATGPLAASARPATNSIADELDRFVADQAERGLFSGTVQLDHCGHTVLAAAHGLADRDVGTRNTPDTRFTAASVGKFVTAVTAARLVQNGRLAFGTTFGQAVPELRNPALRPLTLHQLLTHTAALPEVSPPFESPTGRAIDQLPLLEGLELTGTPGERWQYSNAGYLAAAIMIERAGRRPFTKDVHADVLVPARMHSTLLTQPDRHDRRVAVRYAPDGEAFPPDIPSGAGGLYTTAGDLVAFADALMRRRLLDDTHTTEVITGKVPAGRGDLYAYGCSDITVAGHRIIWHNGGAPGANAWLQIYPNDGYILATLSNVWGFGYRGGVQPIVNKAQQLITGSI